MKSKSGSKTAAVSMIIKMSVVLIMTITARCAVILITPIHRILWMVRISSPLFECSSVCAKSAASMAKSTAKNMEINALTDAVDMMITTKNMASTADMATSEMDAKSIAMVFGSHQTSAMIAIANVKIATVTATIVVTNSGFAPN